MLENLLEKLAVECWQFANKCEDAQAAEAARDLAEEIGARLDALVGISPSGDD